MSTLLFENWPDTPDNLPLWEQYGPSLNPAATVATDGVLYMTLPAATQSYIYWHAPAGGILPSLADGSVFTWQVDIDDDGNTNSAMELNFEPLARRAPFDIDTYWRLSWYSDGSLYLDVAGSSPEPFTVATTRTWYRLRRAGDTIHFEHAQTAAGGGGWTEITSRSGYTDTPTDVDFNWTVNATVAGTGSQARLGRIGYESFAPGTYAGEVAADTPSAFWALEEDVAASVAVDSISGHDGTYPSPSGAGITRVAGLHAGSTYARRQDTGDWATIFAVEPSGDIISSGEFALEVWAAIEGTTGGAALLSAGDPGWEAYASIEVNVLGHTAVGFLAADGTVLLTYDEALSPGPHHFVLTADTSTITLYIDGAEAATSTHALDFNAAITARAMSGTDALTVDSAAVYDHTLSPERILAHYVAGGGPAAPANDNFADAIPVVIPTDGATFTSEAVDNTYATVETGEPNVSAGGHGRTLWWSYTPTSGGEVTVDTVGSTGDTTLGVYTGTAVDDLTEVVFDAPAGGDWPGPTNTGTTGTLTPDARTSLTGPITVTGKQFDAGLQILGSGTVLLSNCEINASGEGAVVVDCRGASGATVTLEDCTINGGGEAWTGVHGHFAAVRRCELTGIENPFKPYTGAVMEDNWVHNLVDFSSVAWSPHSDGIEMDGGANNLVVQHNFFDATGDTTSGLMFDNYDGASDNNLIHNNKIWGPTGGGGAALYIDGSFNSSSLSNYTVTDNRIRPASRSGGDPVYAVRRGSTPGFTQSGNVDDDTDAPITL